MFIVMSSCTDTTSNITFICINLISAVVYRLACIVNFTATDLEECCRSVHSGKYSRASLGLLIDDLNGDTRIFLLELICRRVDVFLVNNLI